jgi:hypothetical protein
MKKLISILVIGFVILSAWGQRELDFRKVSWGMSKAQVLASEDLELFEQHENTLIYKTNLMGFDAITGYIFAGDKLTRSKYIFTEEHTDKNDFILDYEKLKGFLKKKYGEPDIDEVIWKNEMFKDNQNLWGYCVSMGHVYYYTIWKTNRTRMGLVMDGDNFNIKTVIEYQSIEFEGLEAELTEKKLLSELPDSTFRFSKWGSTKAQVREDEILIKGEESENLIVYNSNVLDMDAYIAYIFVNDTLTRGKFIFREDHTNKNDFIYDYKKLQSLLIKKYGIANVNDTIWKDDLYKDDKEDWGLAISMGHLTYFTTWVTDDIELILHLSGENAGITLLIEFTSLAYKEYEKNYREREILDEF